MLYKSIKIKTYGTLNACFLYGCGTWPLTLIKEHRLGVFKNWMPRNVFERKRVDVTGEWIKIFRTIVLPVVLYGCENWFLSLTEVLWGT